jgi:hypothetical protein
MAANTEVTITWMVHCPQQHGPGTLGSPRGSGSILLLFFLQSLEHLRLFGAGLRNFDGYTIHVANLSPAPGTSCVFRANVTV